MFQQILDALKAKFQGVSDNVLSRIAKNLAKTATTAEQVKTAVEAYTLQQVIDTYSDSRATEASQTATRNYEQKYGLKDGEKINQGGEPTKPEPTQNSGTQQTQGGDNQTPAWAQSLIEANKALTERLNRMEGERTTSNRRQQLAKIVEQLPETLRKPYERISLDTLTDEEFTTLTAEVTTEVSGISNEIKAKGAVFGRPANSQQGGSQTALTKDQQAAIAHREGIAGGDNEQPF